MKEKLFGEGDVKVLRESKDRGLWITPQEMREVLQETNEVGYTLYSYYRTYSFKEAAELDDQQVGEAIGWNPRRVRDYRLVLTKAGLFHSVRYGTKKDGITRVFVGKRTVALFNAGMSAELLNPRALRKLEKEFKVGDLADFIAKAPAMAAAFNDSPEDYK